MSVLYHATMTMASKQGERRKEKRAVNPLFFYMDEDKMKKMKKTVTCSIKDTGEMFQK